MKRLWALVVDIYEPQGAGMDFPIVTHVFRGWTQKEAQGYYEAHLGTDAFLRGCVTKGRWSTVNCVAKMRWERT